MSGQSSTFRGGVGVLGLLALCAFVQVCVSRAPPAVLSSSAPPAILSEPAFEFAYRGNAVADMQFSPDGRKIALVTFESKIRDRYGARFAARIYNLPRGTLDHELPGGAWKSAWTMDGSILALPRRNDAKEIDLWDTRTWTVRQSLDMHYPKSLDTQPYVVRFCFDQHSNLYIAEFEYGFEGYGFGTTLEYSPRVWWHLGDHWGPEAELFGFCSHPTPYSDSIAPYDLSVSSVGKETRVAFTSWNCWAQILKVRENIAGKGSVELEFSVRIGGWIKLTPDGQKLVWFHGQPPSDDSQKPPDATTKSEPRYIEADELRVLRLFEDHVKTLGSQTVALEPPMDTWAPELMDVSRDGEFAAICTRRGINIHQIPSCRPVAEIPTKFEVSTAICFSPDGHFLAVDDQVRHVIRFYRVPQLAR